MIPMPPPNAAHGQKSHGANHFNYLDQTNAMVVLMMPFALHDADAVPLTSHDQESCTVSHFDNLVKNGMVPLMTLLTLSSSDTTTKGII